MVEDINYLLTEIESLILEKEALYNKLNEAKEVIEAIKKGHVDAVFVANNEIQKVWFAETADQTYRRFIENMSQGVITLHTDGIIVFCNSSFAKMVNLPVAKVIGTNLRNFLPIEHIEKFERFFSDYSESSKVELSILSHEGIPAYFIVSLNKLQLHDFVALNLVWTDVTDQKKAEEKLITVNESLNNAIEERIYSEKEVVILNNRLIENIKILEDTNVELATFAHIASHDLQEPLRKIIIYSSILRRNYYDIIDQRGQDYIDKMQGASERMRNLINDILEYSELSQKDSFFKVTNLHTIVKEILANFEVLIRESKAKIIVEKELPVIEANTSQMRQLFQNIISNALKFRKDGIIPEITITYEMMNGKHKVIMGEGIPNEKFYKFYIRDNGIGFDPVYKDQIFTIFQRLNSNSVYKGTGIGLAICKKIVENHNGYITAEGNINDGALFTIVLPVSQAVK